MKFRIIFLFELKYQLRQLSTWVYFAVAFLIPVAVLILSTPTDESVYLNAPSNLIFVTVFSNVVWLLTSGSIAGDAGSRDVQSRMHPLVYTAPVSKREYLGGRFLAAILINAMIHLVIPLAFYLNTKIPGTDPMKLSPFRLEAYLTTYFYLSLPLAFVATACQFSSAVLNRKTIAAFLASLFLFPVAFPLAATITADLTKLVEFRYLMDTVGLLCADTDTWTSFEKNNHMIRLEGIFFWNRFLWLTIATGFFSYAYFRFRFYHNLEKSSGWNIFRRKKSPGISSVPEVPADGILSVPQANPSFGLKTHLCQAWVITWSSFKMIAKNKIGFTIVALVALHFVVFGFEYLKFRGVPQYPATMQVLSLLTASLTKIKTPLVIIPILIVYFSGELIWREREVGLTRISDTLPVSEWSIFLGKFSGLCLVIAIWMGYLFVAGILIQVTMGYGDIGFLVFLKVFFGLQFINYMLFALLALVVHVLVNQKYLGHMVILFVFLLMTFHSKLGIEHNLLVYASDPGWTYTDMRGFGPTLEPWIWFKIYWTGWAILLAVAARLFLIRELSVRIRDRIRLASHRFSRPTAIISALALCMILGSGIYIFYNTNILNNYASVTERMEQQALYELNYKKFKNIPQPNLTDVKLYIELYPEKKKAYIQGSYKLVNLNNHPVDSIHLGTPPNVETNPITFDREAVALIEDKKLGHRIYKLKNPLQPGDSLCINFQVHYQQKGFSNNGIESSVIENGSYLVNYEWLPSIGYNIYKELRKNVERKKYGLGPWAFPSVYDTASLQLTRGQELVQFEAIVGTSAGQVAIGPGALLRKWTEGKRNYYHYASSAPIGNTYSFFSARYAEHKEIWKDSLMDSGHEVEIRFYYHPTHAVNLGRMVQSTKASLSYFSKNYGLYPYKHLTIIERPGYAGELKAKSTTIDYGESFTLSNIEENPWALDLVYFAIAHEVAHQWFGSAQLIPAVAEGLTLLTESLANYSGLNVLEETYGKKQVKLLLDMWRESYEVPRSRATASLLQANDAFLGYRKGPLALYALTQYIGKERVNFAIRQLIVKHGSGKPPLPTSLDLYRELQAVTPDTLHYLLYDYFEKNIYWQLKTEKATAVQVDTASWKVKLDVHAKKVVIDSTGAEIPVPMDDWVEVGIFAPWVKGKGSGGPLHLQKHRIRSGKQTVTVTVQGEPARAGIDPNYLLIDLNTDDNIRNVKIKK